MFSPILLDGHSLTLAGAEAISSGKKVAISAQSLRAMEESRKQVSLIASGDQPAYGINTGFGYFARKKISSEELKQLQHNIIVSHASGWGEPLSVEETRLAMALRLNVLCKGVTGVRTEVGNALASLINGEIYPLIPEHGSVGASGDLAPLAHLALPLIGLGKVRYKGEVMEAAQALSLAGISPIELQEKEGLGLINGTQIMMSVGVLALNQALRLVQLSDWVAALTFEALEANPSFLDSRIHELRGQEGQKISAYAMRQALKGSFLFESSYQPLKLQDGYSLRCAPQVHGACRDSLLHSRIILERELNAATDNPLICEEQVLSGGNFHGQPIAMALDIAGMALAELGSISERRFEQLINPHLSGLPAFLTAEEGVQSGYMAAQYLSASLVSENRGLAHPASIDSIPGNVGVEDHVSMGPHAARQLRSMGKNLLTILAVEALGACQALDLKKLSPSGEQTLSLYQGLREEVAFLHQDRVIHEDVIAAREFLSRKLPLLPL